MTRIFSMVVIGTMLFIPLRADARKWCLFACGSAGHIARLAARTFTAQNSVASFYVYG